MKIDPTTWNNMSLEEKRHYAEQLTPMLTEAPRPEYAKLAIIGIFSVCAGVLFIVVTMANATF